MKNFGWVLLGIGLVVLWLFFPTIFSWWAEYAWHVPAAQLAKKSDLGPLGDIYGSLNTLISSIALCAVAYSTWLQVTSLKETRKATTRQLKLAEENHQEQLKESRNAIFTTQFYSLLNYKNERLKNLELKSEDLSVFKGQEFFALLRIEAQKVLDEFKDDMKQLTPEKLRDKFIKISKKYNKGKANFDMFSYFEIYSALIQLLAMNSMDKDYKEFYRSMICRSMTPNEQIVLFIFAPMWGRIHLHLKDSFIFNSFELNTYNIEFAKLHYDKTCFAHESHRKMFDESIKPQPKSG